MAFKKLFSVVHRLHVSLLIVMVCQGLDHDLVNFLSHTTGIGNVATARQSLFAQAAHCPKNCDCNDKKAQVNCSNANTDLFPITFNPKMSDFDFSHNRLRTVNMDGVSLYPRLKRLSFAHNELTNLIDATFTLQSQLEILNLEGNHISYLAPRSLFGLHKLIVLKLNSNDLRNVTEPVFSNTTQLETLDLTSNKLGYLSENAFDGLRQLKNLYLRDNYLGLIVNNDYVLYKEVKQITNMQYASSLVIMAINGLRSINLPQLEVLDLSWNKFNAIIRRLSPFSVEDTGFTWDTLRELRLDGCMIEYIEPGSFDGLKALSVLKLHANSFKEIPSEMFKDIPRLEKLEICQNRFTTIVDGAFSSLPQLRVLDISKSPYLETIKPGAFKGNIRLERLDLLLNPSLQTIEAATFEDLPNLRYLLLRGNNFTTIDEKWVPFGNRLELLDVRDSEVVCDCGVDPLRRILLHMRNTRTPYNGEHMRLTSRPSLSPLEANKDAIKDSSVSFRSFVLASSEIKCTQPESLSGQLLINLTVEDLGCYDMEWLTIIIALIVAVVITTALCSVIAVRYRRGQQHRRDLRTVNAFQSEPLAVSSTGWQLTQSKLFNLNTPHTPSHKYVMDKDYDRPIFIVPFTPSEKINAINTNVNSSQHSDLNLLHTQLERHPLQSKHFIPSTSTYQRNNLNNPCNPYEVVPITGWRTDSMCSFGHVGMVNSGSHVVDTRSGSTMGRARTLRAKPTTEL